MVFQYGRSWGIIHHPLPVDRPRKIRPERLSQEDAAASPKLGVPRQLAAKQFPLLVLQPCGILRRGILAFHRQGTVRHLP